MAPDRARRAVPLVAAAIAVAVVAGLIYLRPTLPGPAVTPPAPSPSPPTLDQSYEVAYDFITPALGWALVDDPIRARYSVFHTTDGAHHWKLQRSGIAPFDGGLGITFFDRDHGYYQLAGSVAFSTSDGGAGWTAVSLPGSQLAQTWFVDPLHGWYRNDTDFESTQDGGQTWRRLPAPPLQGPLMEFRNPSEGWMASIADNAPATMYTTGDGGTTWQPHELPPDSLGKPFHRAQGLLLLPGRGALVIMQDGTAYTTPDGNTWKPLAPPPSGNSYFDIAFQDASNWWAMGQGDLFKTKDGGQTWDHIALQLGDPYYHLVRILDARHAFARLQGPAPFAGSALAVTSDGGVHWMYVAVPTPA